MKYPKTLPLYVDDWLQSARIFEAGLEAEGALMRLLAAMWQRGGRIPDDKDFCCHVLHCKPAKWRKIRAVLIEKGLIIEEDSSLFNPRLTMELDKVIRKNEKYRQNSLKKWREKEKNREEKPNKINDSSDATAMPLHFYKKRESKSSAKNNVVFPDWWDKALQKEWKAHRQKKRATTTQLVVNHRKQVAEACSDITDPASVIRLEITSGWQGLEESWVRKRLGGRGDDSKPRQDILGLDDLSWG